MRSALTAALLLFALTVSCAGNTSGTGDGTTSARARIENGTSLDMDIYLFRQSGASSRLGFVPAGESATFELPPGLIAGAVSVRFQARPVRGSGRAVGSELFPIRPGEDLVWSIPAQ